MLCRRCIKQKSKIKQKQNDVEKLQKRGKCSASSVKEGF